MEKKMYGLPPAMAIDVASSYLLSKARLSPAEREIERMQNISKPSNLVEQMVELLIKGEGDLGCQVMGEMSTITPHSDKF
jgi:hypothetical protein